MTTETPQDVANSDSDARVNITKVATLAVAVVGLAAFFAADSTRADLPLADLPEIPATIPGDVAVDHFRPAQPSFMRQKLASTNKIVEGLAVENFPLIIEGTDELLHLAEEASWRVRRDEYFMYYSRDFKETVRELQLAAKARNLERATFAYNHATLSCTVCHRHVRGVVKVSR